MLEQGVDQASDVNQAGLTRQQQQSSRPLADVFSTFPGALPRARSDSTTTISLDVYNNNRWLQSASH